MTVSARFLYAGLPDYWGGDGDRWDDNKGCLFADYDGKTFLCEIVDRWVADFYSGGDCDSFPDDILGSDIRAAILEMLGSQGRTDYLSCAVAECAADYAAKDEPGGYKSPVCIILIEVDVCSDCGRADGC